MRTRGRLRGSLLLTVALCGAIALAATSRGETAGDARSLLQAAVSRAKAEHKVVLVEFGASYCGWCRRFAQLVRTEPARTVIDAHFVVVELAVQETNGRATPGGDDLLKSWGGADAGLPFLVFLDSAGAKVADSNAMPSGGNIGYPVDPDEIDAFLGMLARSGARLSPAERSTLISDLSQKPSKG